MLLKTLLESFRNRPSNRAKPHSFQQYECTVSRFGDFLDRKPEVRDITEQCLSDFTRWMEAQGSVSTANSKRQHLLTLAKFAVYKNLLRSVPQYTYHPEPPKRVPDSWHPHEVAAILKACDTQPACGGFTAKHWRLLVLLIYDTTARKNAVLQTLRSDVQNGNLRLDAKHQKRNNEQWPDLSAEALALIAELPESPDGRLFPWQYTQATLGRHFREIVERAGLQCGRRDLFQKLRRTAITQTAIAHGVERAQIRAGHASQKQTWSAYLDVSKMPSACAAGIARPV